jgi:hypothetical protein
VSGAKSVAPNASEQLREEGWAAATNCQRHICMQSQLFRAVVSERLGWQVDDVNLDTDGGPVLVDLCRPRVSCS